MKIEHEEQLSYLLYHTDYYIENLLWRVLEDSEQDPHYSAVTTSNLIKCYIDVMSDMGKRLPYQNAEGYLDHCLSEEEKALFKKKYETEIQYYIGEVY